MILEQTAGEQVSAPGKVAHRTMREVNRSLVLDILREGGQVTRVDLARRTELSKPTVSAIVDLLLREGLVLEVGTGQPPSRGGRPPSLLVYNDRAGGYVGIQFGAHTTHVAVADALGKILVEVTTPAVHGDMARSVHDARQLLRSALRGAKMRRSQVRGIGVAVMGLVEKDTGRCVIAPNLGWRDAPIRAEVERAFGVPTVVVNAADAAAIAEYRLGFERPPHSLVWVYTGAGVGAGIVVEGALFTGHSGFSGEIGHVPVVVDGPLCGCGKRGCLETMAAAPAIVRAAEQAIRQREATALKGHRGQLDSERVARAAADGDAVARRLIAEAGGFLGLGIIAMVAVLNPEVVVIGGPLARAGDEYLGAVQAALNRHTIAAEIVPVVPTRVGLQAPLIGVIHVAVQQATPSYRVVAEALAT